MSNAVLAVITTGTNAARAHARWALLALAFAAITSCGPEQEEPATEPQEEADQELAAGFEMDANGDIRVASTRNPTLSGYTSVASNNIIRFMKLGSELIFYSNSTGNYYYHTIKPAITNPKPSVIYPTFSSKNLPYRYYLKDNLAEDVVDGAATVTNQLSRRVLSDGKCQGGYCIQHLLLRCSSVGYARKVCQSPEYPVGQPVVHKRFSDAACVLNKSYGITKGDIWVDDGCSADFVIPFKKHPTLKSVRCMSSDFAYKLCPVSGVAGLPYVVKQYSTTNCVAGKTFGATTRGIWVNKGCQADFRVKVFP